MSEQPLTFDAVLTDEAVLSTYRRMFAALANEKINVDCISSSEMTMSCVIALADIDRGVKAVHDEFFANAPAKTKTVSAGVK